MKSAHGAAFRVSPEHDALWPDDEAQALEQVRDLYREHSPAMVRQLARATGCREAARDLMHETFVRLVRMAPANLARIKCPEAWLNCVSKNLLRDWGRSRKVAETSKAALEIVGETSLDQIAMLENRETLRRLERAMARLKPKTRDIFIAHRIEGASYAEIAELTGLSVRTVEWHIREAIAKLDHMLNRD